ncbi:unnamed protein product [Symbiodinium sp. CCMP2456]|nr:unnamed protein product [Symbiodinium sp. CCMP2456]
MTAAQAAQHHLGLGFRVGIIAVALALAKGDGPLVTTTTTTTKDPYIGGCNPFNASYNLFTITLAGPIQASCFSSWRLHEVEMFEHGGFKLYNTYYHIPSRGIRSYSVSEVIDGDSNTFVNLNSDVGIGCNCWNSDKIGSVGLRTIKQRYSVARIKLTQGGDSNYSVSRMKIQCGNRYTSSCTMRTRCS